MSLQLTARVRASERENLIAFWLAASPVCQLNQGAHAYFELKFQMQFSYNQRISVRIIKENLQNSNVLIKFLRPVFA
jgi:hypothetical protein